MGFGTVKNGLHYYDYNQSLFMNTQVQRQFHLPLKRAYWEEVKIRPEILALTTAHGWLPHGWHTLGIECKGVLSIGV